MSPIGWEFYGIKFSLFLTMLTGVCFYLSLMFYGRNRELGPRIDRMAGDEGED